MPLQNRVTPLGELIADPARGLIYGNRGCLHDDAGRIRSRYDGKRWIACRLRFRGWRRGPLQRPGVGAVTASAHTCPSSTITLSRSRSLRFARRIAAAIIGAATLEKPVGSPRFRSVIRVRPSAAFAQA